jgi:hypothetical protein
MRIREHAIGEPMLVKLTQLAASGDTWAEHYARLAEVVAILERLPPDDVVGAGIFEQRPPSLMLVHRHNRSVSLRPDRYDGVAGVDAPLHFRLRINRGEKQISDELRITEPAAAAARIRESLTDATS